VSSLLLVNTMYELTQLKAPFSFYFAVFLLPSRVAGKFVFNFFTRKLGGQVNNAQRLTLFGFEDIGGEFNK
jgi:hypothetical protein